MTPVDSRLAAAVAASRSWYDDVMALHGVPVTVTDALWVADGPVPPFHSTVLALRPDIDADAAAEAVRTRQRAGLPGGGIADCFADLDLAGHGFDQLFEARWIHRAAPEPGLADGWSELSDPRDLHGWSERHDYVGVLPDTVLRHPRFRVLARRAGGGLIGGAVTHELGSGDVVGLSNVWESPGTDSDWLGLLAAVGRLHPRRPVVGYERGPDLERALVAGFDVVGTHRVWVPAS
ncbi:hypothetical protein G5T42_04665 [Microbacterium sp. 4R-513]|uniref:hypothetical protein n=1 Tax=Microbacterium sp. 4R-513 TaxID=2567934 RepID=UPI0013E201CD|nr:hypothetical protein [Microbacterium sp. 4R-513]QIG38865.1 hypothetical protein G5T42_04665 [Microbacterium sp. 4R-513]